MMQTIQQNTPEWLSAKLSTIGGSEIYALVVSLLTEEEIKQYLPYFEYESSFGSVMKTAIKFLYGITSEIGVVNSEYGNAMELPMVHFFNKNFYGLAKAQYTRDFIVHDKYKNISCSPDGYIDLESEVEEFGNQDSKITKEDDRGLLELKTITHSDAWNEEAKMQYLFQCNWNAWVCGLNWYCVYLSYAKDYEGESDFKKGKRVVYSEKCEYDKIAEEVEFKEYFYKTNHAVINLCKLAFKRFVAKIKEARTLDYGKMWSVFQFSNKHKIFLEERKLLSQIQDTSIQEKFGKRDATDKELDMILERFVASAKINQLQERKDLIDAHFIKELLNNTEVSATWKGFDLKCKETKSGISYSPTSKNKPFTLETKNIIKNN
jgi:hypothetical protein